MQIDDRTEWLEADGLGGFASGTTNGIRTRRYHALLLTAVTPPTGRIVLVNGFDVSVDTPRPVRSPSRRSATRRACYIRTAHRGSQTSPLSPGQHGSSRRRPPG